MEGETERVSGERIYERMCVRKKIRMVGGGTKGGGTDRTYILSSSASVSMSLIRYCAGVSLEHLRCDTSLLKTSACINLAGA